MSKNTAVIIAEAISPPRIYFAKSSSLLSLEGNILHKPPIPLNDFHLRTIFPFCFSKVNGPTAKDKKVYFAFTPPIK